MRAGATLLGLALCGLPGALRAQPVPSPIPEFAAVDQLTWAARARDVIKAQRDEYVERYTSAEIALGVLLAEHRRLAARVAELEAKLKGAQASPPPSISGE
ncbi:MAG: hypothetical protein IT537_03250 [Hyphomicrobiales bacterium]|nr:hypothetical protein [Hyphomicrobiales bacterium]